MIILSSYQFQLPINKRRITRVRQAITSQTFPFQTFNLVNAPQAEYDKPQPLVIVREYLKDSMA